MKRLLIAPLVVAAALTVAPTTHADPGGGAFHVQCTDFPGAFPGATGGELIVAPGGTFNSNCRYPGPAEGGGVEIPQNTVCIVTPAGSMHCNTHKL
ncbi:MAG: hypothetical protein LC808_40690 [Actinobacteria bacterium]|nr:hypothetical protein [Actinomycetota bacterium]